MSAHGGDWRSVRVSVAMRTRKGCATRPLKNTVPQSSGLPRGMSMTVAAEFKITNCDFLNFTDCGLHVANTINADSGDSVVSNCFFYRSASPGTPQFDWRQAPRRARWWAVMQTDRRTGIASRTSRFAPTSGASMNCRHQPSGFQGTRARVLPNDRQFVERMRPCGEGAGKRDGRADRAELVEGGAPM